MDDLISRQAAIDALCNDYCGGHQDCKYYPNCENLRSVQKLPSAQPEIIHCGECTKMKVDSVFHDCWCSETGKKVWIDHYCGYAERREVTT